MFFLCLVLFSTFVLAWTENMTLEVRLSVDRPSEGRNVSCVPLISRSPMVWNSHEFWRCIPHTPQKLSSGGYSLPYSVSVNTQGITGFPYHGNTFEKLAFINLRLNLKADYCATTVGPPWRISSKVAETAFDIKLNILLFQNIDENIICLKFVLLAHRHPKAEKILDCKLDSVEALPYGGFRYILSLKLHANPQYWLLSEGIFKTLRSIKDSINVEIHGCINVTRVKSNDEDETKNITVQFYYALERSDSCVLLRSLFPAAYSAYDFKVLRCDQPIIVSPNEAMYVASLRTRQNIYGLTLTRMSDAGVALFLESIFNAATLNCGSYQQNSLTQLLHQVHGTEHYFQSAVISGPTSVNICNQTHLWMAEAFDIMYSSCQLQITGCFDIKGMKTALYRLKLKKLLYSIDANSYIFQLTKMIDAFNRPFHNCPFNGFIF